MKTANIFDNLLFALPVTWQKFHKHAGILANLSPNLCSNNCSHPIKKKMLSGFNCGFTSKRSAFGLI